MTEQTNRCFVEAGTHTAGCKNGPPVEEEVVDETQELFGYLATLGYVIRFVSYDDFIIQVGDKLPGLILFYATPAEVGLEDRGTHAIDVAG